MCKIHEKLLRRGFLENNIVLSSALMNMYAKCGALEKAQQVLEGLFARDTICWNALIREYTQ